MERIALVVTFLIQAVFARSDSPLLRSVEVDGNHSFSSREILSWLTNQPSAPLRLDQLQLDLKTILSRYQQAGHYFAALEHQLRYSSDSSSAFLTVRITEGPRVTIGRITVSGNRLLSTERIIEGFETRVGAVLDERFLEQDLEELLTSYENHGFPFAKARVQDISLAEDGESLNIAIDVDEGPLVRISEIRVEGNLTTKDDVVIRETRVNLGEAYDHRRVTAIQPRLMRLNVFKSVSDPELYLQGSRAGLLIKVQEGNANTFDGILGYVPASGGQEKGFLTGLVSVSMRNLFGTARKLNARWQRENRSTQDLGIRYLEPWVFGFPLNVGLGFGQRQQDSTYVKRRLELSATMPLSDNFIVGAALNRESVIPSSDRVTPSPVSKSNTTLAGFDLEYDTRDDAVSPREGLYYRADYQIGRKKITSPVSALVRVSNRATVQRLSVDVQYVVPSFTRQVLALSLHGRELRGSPIDESDLFRLGGTNSLRGYRENQFLASRVVWGGLEYRFLLGHRSFFYGFFDGGYYFRPGVATTITENGSVAASESVQDFKHGIGIGLRVETRLGLIGVSFAFGEGDTFSTGKVHVGLINDF